ncbi:MAG: acylphosphatase [Chitinophagaceae bacterium]
MQTIVMTVTGKVQGVFFRQTTRQQALASGITGTVRNLADGSVQIIATGTKEQLDTLIAWCRKGPSGASVAALQWRKEELKEFDGFTIVK